MATYAADSSPWWYRQRAIVIGVVFGVGFFLGNLALSGAPPSPSVALIGARIGSIDLVDVLAVLATLAAWCLRVWGSAFLTAKTVYTPDTVVNRLVISGPYRFVRNPLYFANIIMALGIGAFAAPFGYAIVVLGNVAIAVLLAREEVRVLAPRFGPVYADYRAKVRALVPRFTPAVVPGSADVAPAWRQAVLGELPWIFVPILAIAAALFLGR